MFKTNGKNCSNFDLSVGLSMVESVGAIHESPEKTHCTHVQIRNPMRAIRAISSAPTTMYICNTPINTNVTIQPDL